MFILPGLNKNVIFNIKLNLNSINGNEWAWVHFKDKVLVNKWDKSVGGKSGCQMPSHGQQNRTESF